MVLGTGYWVLGIGYWVLGTGYWVLGTGYWVFGIRYWVLESYQISYVQFVQNIGWHICKTMTNKNLRRSELNLTLSRRFFRLRHLNYGISDLFRISSFEFRISGLSGSGAVEAKSGSLVSDL